MPTGLAWSDVRRHPAARAVPLADRERVLRDLSVLEHAWIEGKLHRMKARHP